MGQFHGLLQGDQPPVHKAHRDRRYCYGHPLAYRHARWPLPPWLSQTGFIGYGALLVEPGGASTILTSRTIINSSLGSFFARVLFGSSLLLLLGWCQ